MANKRVKGLAGLEQAVAEILNEYADEVSEVSGNAIKDVAKAGVKAIKEEANAKFDRKNAPKKGRYSTGWTTTVYEGRMNTTAVIHNKKYAGMPHLLEFGHLVSNGKRVFPKSTKARPHIEPVQNKLEEMVMKRITTEL